MKRIAPELDSLMWTLAEEGNERAIDEFGARHPEFRGELIHRINMVKGLRSAKSPGSAVAPVIPRFTPREPHYSPIRAKAPVAIVGGLVLAALAAAAFTITTILAPEPRIHPGDIPVKHQNQPLSPQTDVVRSETPPVVVPPVTDQDPVVMGIKSEASKKPTILRVDGSPLLTVLEMMSEITGTKIVAAPGMPNPTVEVNYQNMPAIDMLRDLGRKYAFTPLDQHDGSILVVPVVDKASGNQAPGAADAIPGQKVGG